MHLMMDDLDEAGLGYGNDGIRVFGKGKEQVLIDFVDRYNHSDGLPHLDFQFGGGGTTRAALEGFKDGFMAGL